MDRFSKNFQVKLWKNFLLHPMQVLIALWSSLTSCCMQRESLSYSQYIFEPFAFKKDETKLLIFWIVGVISRRNWIKRSRKFLSYPQSTPVLYWWILSLEINRLHTFGLTANVKRFDFFPKVLEVFPPTIRRRSTTSSIS